LDPALICEDPATLSLTCIRTVGNGGYRSVRAFTKSDRRLGRSIADGDQGAISLINAGHFGTQVLTSRHLRSYREHNPFTHLHVEVRAAFRPFRA